MESHSVAVRHNLVSGTVHEQNSLCVHLRIADSLTTLIIEFREHKMAEPEALSLARQTYLLLGIHSKRSQALQVRHLHHTISLNVLWHVTQHECLHKC